MAATSNVAVATFDPILPAPTRDYFTFDFTREVQNIPPGAPPGTPFIQAATWSITIEPTTADPTLDPTPASRLIGAPIFDDNHTSHLAGDMVDGVVYVLTAQVTVSDGRILQKSGEVTCLIQREPVIPPLDPGVVPFDYDRFISAYPQFTGVNSDIMERLWTSAGLLFRNDSTSPEQDLPTRAYLLSLLTAHLALLFSGGPGGYGATGMVGRINSKSVNGVSVSADGFPGVNGTQAWYLSTQYGALFWKMTAAYRTMHYFPGPIRYPVYSGYGNFPLAYSRRYYM
jgi:Protein of unknown function (DUF4054)